ASYRANADATGVWRVSRAWSKSPTVTSTRRTPSHLWHTTWNDSGSRMGRATAWRCPQHSHVTIARIFVCLLQTVWPRQPQQESGTDQFANPRIDRDGTRLLQSRQTAGLWRRIEELQRSPEPCPAHNRNRAQHKTEDGEDASYGVEEIGSDPRREKRDGDRSINDGEDATKDTAPGLLRRPFLKQRECRNQDRTQRT